TTLTVKLMEGKTRRDMYRDFFKDKAPSGFEGKVTNTFISLDKEFVSYDLYKKFSGHGASREFLDDFEFRYVTKFKEITDHTFVEAMYVVVPFIKSSNINSYIVSYSIGNEDLESIHDLMIDVETYSFKDVSSDDVKRINKENARKLRHYLVSLPSVQGVPYSCTFKEDVSNELECSI
ncbi:MAG: hypothetical protein Q8K36_06985, partial [Alphaproteobacteria bacterium]|nr:hypothetical protein [Alphaproteobacteria bacterium]